jgi:lysophospholipase L1-like esterase
MGGAYTYSGTCLPPAADAPAGALSLRIAGDSTAAIFPATDPRVGWGAVAQQFFLAMVKVADAAASGRSSKSFIDEGLWSAMKTQIKAGDYVFIEFGHNDEKTADPLRYTDPATTYREYLKTYVCETRNLGAIPVLLTPISRRSFAGTVISPTHGAYPAAVLAVAAETSTPVIDMTERTRVWLEALGPTDSVPYFAPGDNTHLSAMGAPEVAKLVAAGIKDLKLPLASELAP